jgi:deoxycytidine triphosphate deaminase
MILSDRDIRKRLAAGDLQIRELADPELQIQPASVDLRLANEFLVYKPAQVACLDPRDPATLTAGPVSPSGFTRACASLRSCCSR